MVLSITLYGGYCVAGLYGLCELLKYGRLTVWFWLGVPVWVLGGGVLVLLVALDIWDATK